MNNRNLKSPILVLDVSYASYAQRICATALQGLLNREEPLLFLDYGIYDDPLARRTNEIFLDDEIWFGKYRAMLGAQDQRNLEYYRTAHAMSLQYAQNLDEIICKYAQRIQGCIIWDAGFADSVNVALMLAAQEGLLPVEAGMLDWAASLGLPVVHDLRGRWQNRLDLVCWSFNNLFPKCKSGEIACIEPEWQRPEFVDYLVQNKIFTYNLGSSQPGPGQTLLLLLAFGPAWLREILFGLRLDGPLRKLGLAWMGFQSAEVRLHNRIQQAVKTPTYPTIFGWHTRRDDELTFMTLLSANGLRLIPAHLAANFSFHARVQPLGASIPPPAQQQDSPLDEQGAYLTFTLSDGDQLMMMSTAEMGNWYSKSRGEVCFNWEIQPLLVEIAPALLEKFQLSATANDCLIAGPSGAGYLIPPLAPNLPAYLRETTRICRAAGVQLATTYISDPPRRVLRQLAAHNHSLIGYLAGYANLGRSLQTLLDETVIISNQIPRVAHIWDSAEQLLKSVHQLAATAPRPAFIGVHLFAYRTNLEDVAHFAQQITDPHIHIVRGDTFLHLARQHLRQKG
jgi:hypothetical protein